MLLSEKSQKDGKTYTTTEVCKATGIAESTMSMWKSRGGSLGAENMSILADFFGVSTNFFFEE